jgi:hypothetical protein
MCFMLLLFNIWIEVDINVGSISFDEIWFRINNKQKNWASPIIDKLILICKHSNITLLQQHKVMLDFY